MNKVSIIVKNGARIGCMTCISMCQNGAIEIKDSDKGFPVPKINNKCMDCGTYLSVCPNSENEDEA